MIYLFTTFGTYNDYLYCPKTGYIFIHILNNRWYYSPLELEFLFFLDVPYEVNFDFSVIKHIYEKCQTKYITRKEEVDLINKHILRISLNSI